MYAHTGTPNDEQQVHAADLHSLISRTHQSGDSVHIRIYSHLEDVSQGLVSYTGLNHAGSAINGMTETFLSAGCLPAARTAKSSKMEWATSIKAALNKFFGNLVFLFLSVLPSIKPFRSPRDSYLK
ncbi:hypothetical protein GOODEAATRI_023503 [Goodea atripinnis]|uniref:Uncharacterized protein n=1 Tax=Goodea atripinnis TaxID=208336 RepID=A0ABV0PGR4_9TELE